MLHRHLAASLVLLLTACARRDVEVTLSNPANVAVRAAVVLRSPQGSMQGEELYEWAAGDEKPVTLNFEARPGSTVEVTYRPAGAASSYVLRQPVGRHLAPEQYELRLKFNLSETESASLFEEIDIYRTACGSAAGVTPFVAVSSIRAWDRGPAPDSEDETPDSEGGTPTDDRNGETSWQLDTFSGGGVSLTGCVPLVNHRQYEGGAGESAFRGAVRVGGSLALSGDASQGNLNFHVPVGLTMYFHSRPQGSNASPAILGLTAGVDLLGASPDYTTAFVGDTIPTGLLQGQLRPESFVLMINTGLNLGSGKKETEQPGKRAGANGIILQPMGSTTVAPPPASDSTPPLESPDATDPVVPEPHPE